MAENSKIEWTNNTGSPWLGCTEVSPGCAQCYARELTQTRLEPILRKSYQRAGFTDWETRPVWGDKATRVLSKGFWENIKRADRAAAKRGERVKHFPSLMDWLDEMPAGIIDQEGKRLDPVAVLADLLKVIHDTPNTDHLLLTKRTESWRTRIKLSAGDMEEEQSGNGWVSDWLRGNAPRNVWLGTTVEDQRRADERIPELLKIPAKVRFLSVEPMLEEIDLTVGHSLRKEANCPLCANDPTRLGNVSWVICGGESGPRKRPFNCDWARSLRDQCKAASVPFFMKQVDKVQPIPADLMIREFPV